jgi:protein-S-isoprenylcysteine O-methyltransferase Ste14
MLFVFLGCVSFLLLLLHDIATLRRGQAFWRSALTLGGFGTAAYSMFMVATLGEKYVFPPLVSVFGWFVFILFGLALLYALFGNLPLFNTYFRGPGDRTLVTTGMYALSRHPGLLWYCLMLAGLFMATGSKLLLVAALVWGLLDLLHVLVQDYYFFPRILPGYRQYQRETPMLIPTLTSLQRCLSTIGPVKLYKGGT